LNSAASGLDASTSRKRRSARARAELAATIVQVRNDVRRAYFGQIVAEQRLLARS